MNRMTQAHNTEESASCQMTVEKARKAMWLLNNAEFDKPAGTLQDEARRRIGSRKFSA
jgi:hypothetical protein